MRTHAWLVAASVLVATYALAPSAYGQPLGQSLASRINAVRDGTVLMSFSSRPGVCGDGHGSTWTRDVTMGRSTGDGRWVCMAGPVRVSIGRADGQVVSVREWVGGEWNASGSETNLGRVPAADAAHYLVQLARAAGGRSSDDAIAAAAFADSVDISPDLDALVRDTNAPVQSRKQAMFWLGQSDAPVRMLTSLYDGLHPLELREQYVFVLSQRREDAALTKLIDVARSDPDHEIRKRAMFWLGQSRDPKAIDFLRQILTR
jgi:hypothetical protein